jgi:hypothetical protein
MKHSALLVGISADRSRNQPVRLEFFRRRDQYIERIVELPQRPVHFKCYLAALALTSANNQNVHIAAVIGGPSGLGTEEDDLVGVKAVHQALFYLVQYFVADHPCILGIEVRICKDHVDQARYGMYDPS